MIVARPAGAGGVNRGHPAGRKAAFAFVAGGALSGVDAVARQVGTIGGSPTVITGQAVGTALKFNGSTHELRWSNRSTAVNKNMTMAWLGVFDGGGNASPFLSTSASTNTGWRLGTNTGLAVIKGGIVVLNASFIPTTGRPYFFAVSGNSVGTLNFVQRDLLSGVITTGVVSDSNTPQADDGGIVLARDNNGGEFLPCSCAAAMVGYHFMTMDALIDWAQDPWAAWFDRHPADWSLSLPAAGGGSVALVGRSQLALQGKAAIAAAAALAGKSLLALRGAGFAGPAAALTGSSLLALRGAAAASYSAFIAGRSAAALQGKAAIAGATPLAGRSELALQGKAFASLGTVNLAGTTRLAVRGTGNLTTGATPAATPGSELILFGYPH